MAGIYIHIPFCKKACHYCDFHFSTSLKNKVEMLNALKAELVFRRFFLENEPIETIYFGGGTPSILFANEIEEILQIIYKNFKVSENVEITLEANPDDLAIEKLRELKRTLINRLSIGIQSFFDEDLEWMNRAHRSKQAIFALDSVKDIGFENITIDLIYGYPLLSDEKWIVNIEKALAYNIPHISAYALTVEPKTALDSFIKKKIQQPINQLDSINHFKTIIERLSFAGYEHYEISNFCLPGKYSKHNTSYWNGTKYLGIGPSAHSFNDKKREWNISNNKKYLDNALAGFKIINAEVLTDFDKINEYIMTSLRTSKGLSLTKVKDCTRSSSYNHFYKQLQAHLQKGNIYLNNDSALLTLSGKLFADSISSDLFVVE